jgi:ribosomal protein S12
MAPCGGGIVVGAVLRRLAAAAAVAAVVEDQAGVAELMEHAQVIEAMADVAGIAVEDDHQAARIRAGPDRDMPGVERFAVVGGERQCIEAQADAAGVA